MKAIQSLWTKPLLKGSPTNDLSRLNGGFFMKKYFYISCLLSALLLDKWFDKLELYTDNLGKHILVDLLKLPYDYVNTDLEIFNYNPDLWALGKIYAYGMQSEPFVHTDFDVFLLKPLDNKLLNCPVFSQNIEVNFPCYRESLNEVNLHFKYKPAFFTAKNDITAYNCGIFGGQNIDFIKKYASEAFLFVLQNYKSINQIDAAKFNMIFEQYLLAEYAQTCEISIMPMFKDVDNQFHGLANFNSAYVHLVGFYKKSEFLCKTMEVILKNMFPFYYNNLIELLNSNKL